MSKKKKKKSQDIKKIPAMQMVYLSGTRAQRQRYKDLGRDIRKKRREKNQIIKTLERMGPERSHEYAIGLEKEEEELSAKRKELKRKFSEEQREKGHERLKRILAYQKTGRVPFTPPKAKINIKKVGLGIAAAMGVGGTSYPSGGGQISSGRGRGRPSASFKYSIPGVGAVPIHIFKQWQSQQKRELRLKMAMRQAQIQAQMDVPMPGDQRYGDQEMAQLMMDDSSDMTAMQGAYANQQQEMYEQEQPGVISKMGNGISEFLARRRQPSFTWGPQQSFASPTPTQSMVSGNIGNGTYSSPPMKPGLPSPRLSFLGKSSILTSPTTVGF